MFKRRALLVFFLVCVSFANTPFPKLSQGLIHLTKQGSPYFLNGNFVLSSRDTLRIDPGVEVRMGAHAKLLLSGIIEVNGSKENPVKLYSADSSENWNGIHFLSTETPFSVHHLIVENAFRNTISQSSGLFERAQFVNNYYGLWISTSPKVILRACHFLRNRFALSVTSSAVFTEELSVEKNVFGLYQEGSPGVKGSLVGVRDNLEADIRTGSVASGKERVPLSVWQRVESSF